MLKNLVIMAFCLLGFAAPANAQPLLLTLSGTLQGTQSTIMCGPGSSPSCLSTFGGGLAVESYEKAFDQSLFFPDLQQGDNAFSFGFARSTGLWSGIVNNDNGQLTGRTLTFFYEDNGVRFGQIGSRFISASVPTFNVAAVPEPATWALMLLGFLAIGSALRRAPGRALLPA
jgi:hypothetical protein